MAFNVIVTTLGLILFRFMAMQVVSATNSTATPPSNPIVSQPPSNLITPVIIPSEYSDLPPFFYEDELHNIFTALSDHNDFTSWGLLLAGHSTRPVFPDQATLFVPLNAAMLGLRYGIDIDHDLILFHIIPQRLSFDKLRALETLSTLPTLLPSKSLQITATSLNFTIQNTFVTHPDIYLSSVFAVHGVEHVFRMPVKFQD